MAEVVLWLVTKILIPPEVILCIAYQNNYYLNIAWSLFLSFTSVNMWCWKLRLYYVIFMFLIVSILSWHLLWRVLWCTLIILYRLHIGARVNAALLYLLTKWILYYIGIGYQGRSWPGGSRGLDPPSQLQVHFFKWPKSDEFFVGGGGGRGMGIGHMVTICVDLISRLVFILVHNCDLWIYFTITLIVIAAQERSSKSILW